MSATQPTENLILLDLIFTRTSLQFVSIKMHIQLPQIRF